MSKNKMIIGIVVVLVLIISGSVLAVSLSGGGDLSKQLNLGDKYLQEGKYEEAILAFEKAIKIDAKNIDARIGLAKVYVAIDKPEKAEEVLQDAIGIDPARTEPYIELANVYILEGKTDEAIKILEQGYEKTKDENIKKLLDSMKPQPPKASLESGTYEGVQTVEFASVNDGEKIYYTLDGTEPGQNSTEYSAPIQIGEGQTTLSAVVINKQSIFSQEIKYFYEIMVAKSTDKEVKLTAPITVIPTPNAKGAYTPPSSVAQESLIIPKTKPTEASESEMTKAQDDTYLREVTIEAGKSYEYTNNTSEMAYIHGLDNAKFNFVIYNKDEAVVNKYSDTDYVGCDVGERIVIQNFNNVPIKIYCDAFAN